MPKSKLKKKNKVKLSSNTEPKRRSLAPLRQQLEVLTSEANRRAEELIRTGAASRALYEAQRTVSKHNRDEGVLFSSSQPRMRDINRELARVQAFLSDYTSFSSGAEDFSYGLTHGLFGAQWRKDGGEGYDPNRVRKEDADLTFKVYHEVLERGGGWERVIGYLRAYNNSLIEYGSENLINAIYDMVTNFSGPDVEDIAVNRASEMVESMIEAYDKMSKMQQSGIDYGYLNIDSDYERRQKYWQWKIERERYKK